MGQMPVPYTESDFSDRDVGRKRMPENCPGYKRAH